MRLKHCRNRSTATSLPPVLIATILCAAAFALTAVLGVSMAESARAAAYGELARIGKFGEGPGEFDFPSALAVDSETNDAFVVDEPKEAEERNWAPEYRIQEFPPGLTSSIASARIVLSQPPYRFVAGLAVDAKLHRLYVLIGQLHATQVAGANDYAREIRVYSTEATGGVLPEETSVKSATGKPGVAYEFPEVPEQSNTVPANALMGPQGLTVDPTTHELATVGYRQREHPLIQRVTAEQVAPTSQYEDTEAGVKGANGLSAAPDGSLYVLTENAQELGRVVKLSHAFTSATTVVEGRSGERPILYRGSETGGGAHAPGSQIATSSEESGPSGGIVYAFEESKFEEKGSAEPGDYEIRGVSASNGAQQVAFGGNEWSQGNDKCAIATGSHAVAAGSNGIVYALDDGDWYRFNEEPTPTPYGFSLIEFGPGGSNCPEPSTAVLVSAQKKAQSGEPVHAQKGEELELEASSAELHSEKPTKLVWEASGPETFTKEVVEEKGEPASLIMKHRLLKPGLYTITLKMTVSPGVLGQPPAATRQIEVKALPPRAAFEVLAGSEPLPFGQVIKPGQEVTFNAAKSEDPTGGPNGEPTNALKSYTWNFGDGTPPSSGEEVRHAFSNAGGEAIQRTVTLTVTNEEGVSSPPVSQSLTIEGTPAPKEPPKEAPKEALKEAPKELLKAPVAKEAVKPPVVKRPLTSAQKLAAALKACKKKAKRLRASCVRTAKRRYASKHAKAKKKK